MQINRELVRLPELDALIMQMLEKDPQQRPSIKEVLTRLDQAMAPPRYDASPVSVQADPRKGSGSATGRGWRVAALALSAVVLLETAGLAFVLAPRWAGGLMGGATPAATAPAPALPSQPSPVPVLPTETVSAPTETVPPRNTPQPVLTPTRTTTPIRQPTATFTPVGSAPTIVPTYTFVPTAAPPRPSPTGAPAGAPPASTPGSRP